MQRHQFPVRSAFAMTIDKSQGQTFESVGVDLKSSPVFMHGMLYVAFSRVKGPTTLKVHLPNDNPRHTYPQYSMEGSIRLRPDFISFFKLT